MNITPKERGAYTCRFNARIAEPGECAQVALSTLSPQRKQALWAAIKAKDPAKAQALKEAAELAKLFPGSEVVMTKQEIEDYLR